MNEDQKTKIVNQKLDPYQYKDEIELIDLLRIIWKRKYLILLGTLACGLIATIISLQMDKVYSVNMVLRPGILSIGDEEDKNVYIDSPQNIKALIESGTFDNSILKFIKDSNMNNIPKKLFFKVKIPTDSDTIKIQYDTSDIKQGMVIQNRLSNLLLKMYIKLVQYFKNEYDMKLGLARSEIDYTKAAIPSFKRNVKNIEKRINELVSELKLINSNTTNLLKERNKLLSNNPMENNILSALLYSNTIQQNLQLSNHYHNEINKYNKEKENELQKIEKSEAEIAKKLNEIKNLQSKKDNIQNVQILQTATSSPYPIKPKTGLNVILALVAGFLLFLFLAFFLEYLYRSRLSDSSLKQ